MPAPPEIGKQFPDGDIARAVQNTLAGSPLVSREGIQLSIERGCITLQGVVERNWEKQAAESAVRRLGGVRRVKNLIRVKGFQKGGSES